MEPEKNVVDSPDEHGRSNGHSLDRHVVKLPDGQSIASDELPEKDAQTGLQTVEAVTAVWSKQSLILAYVLLVPLTLSRGAELTIK